MAIVANQVSYYKVTERILLRLATGKKRDIIIITEFVKS